MAQQTLDFCFTQIPLQDVCFTQNPQNWKEIIRRIYLVTGKSYINRKNKNRNPHLALDAKCLLRAIDAIALRNSPKQTSRFSDAYNITLSGFASIT
ncbi:MAG: hypothetical protein ACI3YC_02595, partial [Alloprevotella sp.]